MPLGAVDDRVATLFPLVETALQISLDAGAVFGERVVVYGLGAVGALTSLLLQRAGAHVVAVEPRPMATRAVSRLGLRCAAPEDLDDVLAEKVRRPGCRSSSRRPATRMRCARRCRCLSHEGTALVASWYGTKEVTLPLGAEFHRRRLTMRSTQVSTIPARLVRSLDPDPAAAPRRSSCSDTLPLGRSGDPHVRLRRRRAAPSPPSTPARKD